jgi:hypothetical protein
MTIPSPILGYYCNPSDWKILKFIFVLSPGKMEDQGREGKADE